MDNLDRAIENGRKLAREIFNRHALELFNCHARELFNRHGNHSEMKFTESELSVSLAIAFKSGFSQGWDAAGPDVVTELVEVLERLKPTLYNGFEPDNQSVLYELVAAAIRKAKLGRI